MNLTRMTIISTTMGRNPLRRNGVAIMVNKRVQNAVLGCNVKNDRMISVRFQGKPFNITVIQVYAPLMPKKLKLTGFIKTYNTFRTNTQTRCPFHHRGLECKSRSQEIPGVTGKFGLGVQTKAGQRLTEICQKKYTGHSKHPLPTK